MSPTRTHLALSPELCGRPTDLTPGRAVVEMLTTAAMRADEHGLVHGGFVFGLADHAAMLAVNEPTVVLGSADVRFLAPVTAGQSLTAYAEVEESSGKKHTVNAHVLCEGTRVFEGRFACFVLPQHVLHRESP